MEVVEKFVYSTGF